MKVQRSNSWIQQNWMLILIVVFVLFMGKGLKSIFGFISSLLGGDTTSEQQSEEQIQEKYNTTVNEIDSSKLRYPSSFYYTRASEIYELIRWTNYVYSEDEDLHRIITLLINGPGLENVQVSQVTANPGAYLNELQSLGVVIGQSSTYKNAYLNKDEILSIYKAFGQKAYAVGTMDGGQPNVMDSALDYVADNIRTNADLWYWLQNELPSWSQVKSALAQRGVNV
jgi:hypothetical protein